MWQQQYGFECEYLLSLTNNSTRQKETCDIVWKRYKETMDKPGSQKVMLDQHEHSWQIHQTIWIVPYSEKEG